jgi:SOS-response transcriptional repressor LexA
MHPPASENWIQLGRLAGDPECWYFFEKAGLSKSDIARFLPELEARLVSRAPRQLEVEAWKPGAAGDRKPSKVLAIKPRPDAVTLPLLKDAAAAGAPRLVEQRDVEQFILMDRNRVPHPGETTCIRVTGKSMFPTLNEGYIVAVDTHTVEPQRLVEKMVAARDPEGGITIKWLRRDGESWLLVPQHTSPEYPVVVLRPHGGWKIVGEVIWWMGWPS